MMSFNTHARTISSLLKSLAEVRHANDDLVSKYLNAKDSLKEAHEALEHVTKERDDLIKQVRQTSDQISNDDPLIWLQFVNSLIVANKFKEIKYLCNNASELLEEYKSRFNK